MKYIITKERLTKQGITDMGDFLEPYPWKWLLHLTFAYGTSYKRKRSAKSPKKSAPLDNPVTSKGAKKLFKNFMRTLGRGIIYFMVVEWRQNEDVVHIHALLGETSRPIHWKHGKSQIKPYDPTRGARYYILKYFFTDHFDFAFRMPKKIGGSKYVTA